jgi:hypothetical protein
MSGDIQMCHPPNRRQQKGAAAAFRKGMERKRLREKYAGTGMKARILRTKTRRVAANTPRAVHVVECVCGHVNDFDALSWGGHRVLRCKGTACGLYIHKKTLICGTTRKEAQGA